ncbi:hypothetical protein CALCODRAFT_480940 [Calocera cornea HHB12733]|uniref:Uncharacterized protein n=1 Tax=Calocera cornea HHB12733 TaxID=1353952 RepID=A0A165I7B5_9BASI|nr:hypothetical protein CALCODRAFT_480940 [Calocera cornea HHB12733]
MAPRKPKPGKGPPSGGPLPSETDTRPPAPTSRTSLSDIDFTLGPTPAPPPVRPPRPRARVRAAVAAVAVAAVVADLADADADAAAAADADADAAGAGAGAADAAAAAAPAPAPAPGPATSQTLAPPKPAGAKKRKVDKENAPPNEPAPKRQKQLPERQTDNSVNLKAATTKKPTAAERLKARETELLEARAKIAELEAGLTATKLKLRKALKKQKKDIQLIPKPTGQASSKKGYKLQTAMRLDNDKKTYNAVVTAVHAAYHQSGLPLKPRITNYSVTDLNAIFTIAKTKAPVLAAYEGEWATRDLLKQYLKNLKRAAALAAKTAGAVHGEQGGEDEDEEDEGDQDEEDDGDEDQDEDEDEEDGDGDEGEEDGDEDFGKDAGQVFGDARPPYKRRNAAAEIKPATQWKLTWSVSSQGFTFQNINTKKYITSVQQKNPKGKEDHLLLFESAEASYFTLVLPANILAPASTSFAIEPKDYPGYYINSEPQGIFDDNPALITLEQTPKDPGWVFAVSGTQTYTKKFSPPLKGPGVEVSHEANWVWYK